MIRSFSRPVTNNSCVSEETQISAAEKGPCPLSAKWASEGAAVASGMFIISVRRRSVLEPRFPPPGRTGQGNGVSGSTMTIRCPARTSAASDQTRSLVESSGGSYNWILIASLMPRCLRERWRAVERGPPDTIRSLRQARSMGETISGGTCGAKAVAKRSRVRADRLEPHESYLPTAKV